MTQDFQFGAYYVQIAFRDSNGYPKGVQTDPNNVAVNTTMPMYLMKNIISFTPPTPTRELATDRGGQKIRAQADMGVSEFGLATLELSEYDDVFHSYITGSAVDTGSPSGWRQSAANVNQPTIPAMFLVASAQVESISGSNITNKWRHWILPNCQIRAAFPNVSQGAGVNPNPLSYEVVPNVSYRTLTGELFSITDMDVVDDNDLFYSIQTNYPIAVVSYTGTGVASPETFTTAYLPRTNQATTSDKILTEQGVTDTITALSATTGILTTPTAGAAGNIYVLAHETNYTPSP